VAILLRDLFGRLGLGSAVKTSGQKGLHVFVPLNRPGAAFEATRTFSRAVAVTLQRTCPDLVTAKMAKAARRGRVFLNWEQNDAAKTMVCAYSLRAGEEPWVSCPLAWEELERRERAGDRQGLRIGPAQALARAEAAGDLFRDVLSKRQELPHL
jgi:bifunctional non-homologous end joining protein LigD